MNICYFATLPNDLILAIALLLPLSVVGRLRQTNSKFNQTITNDFWHQRFRQDFGDELTYCVDHWSIFYQTYGNVWTFGKGTYGQLGVYDQLDRIVPVRIYGIRAKQVSVGERHTALIDINDNIWTFGHCCYGKLGFDDGKNRYSPAQVPNLKAKQLFAGEDYTFVIDADDILWRFGFNTWTGFDRKEKHIVNIRRIGNFGVQQFSFHGKHAIAIDLEDNVWTFDCDYIERVALGGNLQYVRMPTQIPNFKARQVSTSDSHTVFIDTENNVWGIGWNGYGQLGLGNVNRVDVPTQLPDIRAKFVSAGGDHTVLVDTEDCVWTFGRNEFGQLGVGDEEDRKVPTPVPSIFATGRKLLITNQPFRAKHASAGEHYTILIDFDGNMWTFGKNDTGRLGLGDKQNRNIPTPIPDLKVKYASAGSDHTAIIAAIDVFSR